ncbi:UNVERIFIED_CONTAM: hypothetical protein FKN15_069146 [Acipenser sinensis]
MLVLFLWRFLKTWVLSPQLSVRGKNKKELFGGFFKNMVKTADEALTASTSGLKDLLYRRARSLADYENANKVLDKARMKNKEVKQAEGHQQLCCHRFEKLSGSAKQELTDFKVRRVSAFRKNLIELTELELKHAKIKNRVEETLHTESGEGMEWVT